MDWVHCNVCFYQPGEAGQPERQFRLASCGHIFCQNCERIGSIEKCKICQVPGSTIVLSHEMPAEVQMYFEDEGEVIKKLGKIADFHKSRHIRLNEHYRTMLSKYNAIKEDYFQLKKDHKNLHQENEMFKQKLEEHKRNADFASTFCHNVLLLTSPSQSQSRHQVSPFFSNNSQPSNESFGHGSGYRSGRSSPPAPTRKRVLTPRNYRGSRSQMGRPQTPQDSHRFLTPSIDGLGNLSVKRRTPSEMVPTEDNNPSKMFKKYNEN